MSDGGRADVIRGLHQLADFLSANPDVPLPLVQPEMSCPMREDRAEIDRIAQLLVVGVHESEGCVETSRRFAGGVRYRAYSLSTERMDRWRALISYDGAVTA